MNDDKLAKLVGLEPAPPQETYLDGLSYQSAWIGSKWDIGLRGSYYDLWRKGNFSITVGSMWLAVATIIDDQSGPDSSAAFVRYVVKEVSR